MNQLGLFDTSAAREVRRARRDDPATSKEAAAHSHGVAAEHELLILQVLRDGGYRDWTPHEIGERCGLTSVQVTRRLHDLWADGRIVESWGDEGEVRSSRSKVGMSGHPDMSTTARVQATRATPSGRRSRCWRMP